MPWLIALRVVSLPATTSRMKNDPNSCVGQALAVDLGVHQRGREVVRRVRRARCSPSSIAIWYSDIAARHQLTHVGDVLGVADAEDRCSSPRRPCSHWSRGMPIMSQMICSGSGAANSLHEVALALLGVLRRRWPWPCDARPPRSPRRRFGVKPAGRSAAAGCASASSMLIIEPKNSAISIGMSPMFVPPARSGTARDCGSRAQMSACRVSAQ